MSVIPITRAPVFVAWGLGGARAIMLAALAGALIWIFIWKAIW
jgi:hypothetical protein